MKRNKNHRGGRLALALALLVLLAGGCADPTPEAPPGVDCSEGVSRIRALEERDPDAVDAAIKEHRRQALLAEYEARRSSRTEEPAEDPLSRLEDDPDAVWAMFEDYVIIGDSRGADFRNISALDDSRNLAVYANTADTFVDIYEEIAALNPAYIFVSIGFVDALYDGMEDLDAYKAHMLPLIQDLRDHFPEARIFLNPLFHAVGEGLERFPRWNDIDRYDAVIREIARETGAYYVNCDDILPTEEDYVEDGIHFTNGFMRRWAVRFIQTLYRVEYGIGGGPEPRESGESYA